MVNSQNQGIDYINNSYVVRNKKNSMKMRHTKWYTESVSLFLCCILLTSNILTTVRKYLIKKKNKGRSDVTVNKTLALHVANMDLSQALHFVFWTLRAVISECREGKQALRPGVALQTNTKQNFCFFYI